jgi:hypothetical protein
MLRTRRETKTNRILARSLQQETAMEIMACLVDGVQVNASLQGALMKMNALALEYQRDYVAARRDLNVFDLVNNPSASGKCRVFGLS